MSGRWGEFGQCKADVWDQWRAYRCSRPATSDDGLCGPHRAGAKRRAASEARLDERLRAERRQRSVQWAQRSVVTAWRAENPLDVFPEPWVCPLCNAHVQTAREDHMKRAVASHQEAHGEAWIAYAACAEDKP